MRHEYETIAKAGIVLQIDCPDLAMGRHIQYADLQLDEFRKRAARAYRGAQPCASPIFRPSRCGCICAGATTKARTITMWRSPTSSTSSFRRSRAGCRSRRPIRAMRTNGRCSRRVKLPDGKVLIPGVIESKSNFIEHPELIAQRIAPLCQSGRTRERHCRLRLRLRHLGRPGRGRPTGRLGQDRGDGRRRSNRDQAVLALTLRLSGVPDLALRLGRAAAPSPQGPPAALGLMQDG